MTSEISVKKITYGICGGLFDILLYQIFLVGTLFGKTGSRGIHEAFREADDLLEQCNHQTLASAWYRLFAKKLITYKKHGNMVNPEITAFGRKRLYQKFPIYHKNRPWNGRVYLITYDIPADSNSKRDRLRYFLKQIGCKMLAESTWLTPYNPRELIKDFLHRIKIPGSIIVSDVGHDGGIGESTIQDLLVTLYDLEKLNNRYDRFIQQANKRKNQIQSLLFEYLSILKDDPQLPFPLLPPGWLGEKAFHVYEKIIQDYSQLFTHVRG